MRRAAAAIAAASTLWATPALGAETLQPASWEPGVRLGSAPSAIRFAGVDRYHTAHSVAYALRGGGGFPFGSPNRAAPWWGAATCPRSIIVVAGDTPADALAAAPLSDPTNRSSEPRLTRVATADPSFDPVGGTDRVDTAYAPILVTTSARAGGRRLAAPTRAAALDLRRGGCATAREAIIVGGDRAVPVEVEGELVSLGYEEVFRVGGADRFETAALAAAALPPGPAPAGGDCLDERADDGTTRLGFYGNGVIEFRPGPAACDVYGRAVVLADGSVGADALAAGWWTSLWQVPVLLVAGDGSLPPATRAALGSLAIDTIVVLGGTARIPEPVVEEAAAIAGAVVGRFSGVDRYETSVATATAFGGWHLTGDPLDFDGDRVCLAASSGHRAGWPDALAAGPWCGRLTALADDRPSPARVLEPVEDRGSPLPAPVPSHDAVPVLLVPAGEPPTEAVSRLLAGAFPGGGDWCRGATTTGCAPPGFAVAFGGTSVVSDGALAAVSAAVEGGSAPSAAPRLAQPFRTMLDLTPVYADDAGAGAPRGCVERAGVAGARWLAAYDTPELLAFDGAIDLTTSGAYARGTSVPTCVGLGPAPAASIVAVSPAGVRSTIHTLRGEAERTVTMSGPMRHAAPRTSETRTTADGTLVASWQFRDEPSPPLQLHDGHLATTVEEAAAAVYLRREARGTATFVAEVSLEWRAGMATGAVSGEAVWVDGSWELAGRLSLPGASGGFRATLDERGTADTADDGLVWRADAVRP